jgi:hypothetical protein
MPPMYSTPTGIRSRSFIRASVQAVMPFGLPETYRVFHRLSKVPRGWGEVPPLTI